MSDQITVPSAKAVVSAPATIVGKLAEVALKPVLDSTTFHKAVGLAVAALGTLGVTGVTGTSITNMVESATMTVAGLLYTAIVQHADKVASK